MLKCATAGAKAQFSLVLYGLTKSRALIQSFWAVTSKIGSRACVRTERKNRRELHEDRFPVAASKGVFESCGLIARRKWCYRGPAVSAGTGEAT